MYVTNNPLNFTDPTGYVECQYDAPCSPYNPGAPSGGSKNTQPPKIVTLSYEKKIDFPLSTTDNGTLRIESSGSVKASVEGKGYGYTYNVSDKTLKVSTESGDVTLDMQHGTISKGTLKKDLTEIELGNIKKDGIGLVQTMSSSNDQVESKMAIESGGYPKNGYVPIATMRGSLIYHVDKIMKLTKVKIDNEVSFAVKVSQKVGVTSGEGIDPQAVKVGVSAAAGAFAANLIRTLIIAAFA